MEEEVPSQVYERRLLVLSLLNGRNLNFDICTSLKEADKFDDLVFKFDNNCYIFSQTIFLNRPETKTMTSAIFAGTEQISRFKNDFFLEKYFISFLRVQDLYKDKEISGLIFYTNVSKHDDTLIEMKSPRNPLFISGSNSKICSLNKDSSVVQKLLQQRHDLDILANYLKEFVGFNVKEVVRMVFDNESINYYHYALMVEHVLVKESSEEKVLLLKFHENFIFNINLSATVLMLRKKLQELSEKTDEEFISALKMSIWRGCTGFGDPNDIKNLPCYSITEESVRKFCELLEFQLGQSNGDDLGKRINEKIIKMDYYDFYADYMRLYLEDVISSKRKKNRIEWVKNEEIKNCFQFLEKYKNSSELKKQLIFNEVFLKSNGKGIDLCRDLNKECDFVVKIQEKLIYCLVNTELNLQDIYQGYNSNTKVFKWIVFLNKENFDNKFKIQSESTNENLFGPCFSLDCNYISTVLHKSVEETRDFQSRIEFRMVQEKIDLEENLKSLDIENDLVKYKMESFLSSKHSQWIKATEIEKQFDLFNTTTALLKVKSISHQVKKHLEDIDHKYKITFNETLKNFDKFLKGTKTNFCFLETRETLLTALKIHGQFSKIMKKNIYVNMTNWKSNEKYLLNAFDSLDDCVLIVTDFDFSFDLMNIEEIFKKRKKNKIVLITNKLRDDVVSNLNNRDIIKDTKINISDLKKGSKVLNKEVYYNGKRKLLESVIDPKDADEWNQLINASVIVKLITQEDVEVEMSNDELLVRPRK